MPRDDLTADALRRQKAFELRKAVKDEEKQLEVQKIKNDKEETPEEKEKAALEVAIEEAASKEGPGYNSIMDYVIQLPKGRTKTGRIKNPCWKAVPLVEGIRETSFKCTFPLSEEQRKELNSH